MIKVLFVDDEPNILGGLQRTLRSERTIWEMCFVPNGEEALKRAERSDVDVIVTDMRMPGMSGAELLARMRELSPATVRIALSGYSGPNYFRETVKSAQQFLSKPCDVTLLKHAIQGAAALKNLVSPPMQVVIGGMTWVPVTEEAHVTLGRALAQPLPSLCAIGEIIASDAGLTAKCVALVSTEFFGPRQPYCSPRQTALLLGTDRLKKLFETDCLPGPTPCSVTGCSSGKLLREHVNVATQIASTVHACDKEANKLLIAATLLKLGDLIIHGEDSCDIAAAYLMGLWGYPAEIVESVGWSDNPSSSPMLSSFTLALSHVTRRVVEHRSLEGTLAAIDMDFVLQHVGTDEVVHWVIAGLDVLRGEKE